MKISFESVILLLIFNIYITKTDAVADSSPLGVRFSNAFDAIKKFLTEKFNPSSKRNDSIQFLLYTPTNRNTSCLIQPSAKRFKKCSFNAEYETKFLIHGNIVYFKPENQLNVLKDAILDHDNYNVIVVNWTSPFKSAPKDSELIGQKVAEIMSFIQNHANVSLETFHCIGHGLGSHICGQAGKNVKTLGRISGLDPEGFSEYPELSPNMSLYYYDATFVDAIHTNGAFLVGGPGIQPPVGDSDFYPNGGSLQPSCGDGNSYKMIKGVTAQIETTPNKNACNHFMAFEYFIDSLKAGCKFVAVECQSYLYFEKGLCWSHIKTDMGFFAKKINGIPPMTKFFLNTLESPYCEG